MLAEGRARQSTPLSVTVGGVCVEVWVGPKYTSNSLNSGLNPFMRTTSPLVTLSWYRTYGLHVCWKQVWDITWVLSPAICHNPQFVQDPGRRGVTSPRRWAHRYVTMPLLGIAQQKRHHLGAGSSNTSQSHLVQGPGKIGESLHLGDGLVICRNSRCGQDMRRREYLHHLGDGPRDMSKFFLRTGPRQKNHST